MGQQLLLDHLYGSAGGAVADVRLVGAELTDPPAVEREREVIAAAIVLSRGQSAELTWVVTMPDGSQEPTMSLSPGIESALGPRDRESARKLQLTGPPSAG